jgi:hypothetical protein
MRKQVEHIEMAPNTIGNHVSFKGIAVFEVRVTTDGRVAYARSLTGHAFAVSLLLARADRWQFHPYLRSSTAIEVCGHLKIRFSISDNQPAIEVE